MATSAILRHRRDTAANWTSSNPVLEAGQLGFETDTGLAKLGDGVTAWASLKYTYRPIHVGTTAPSSPVEGDLWIDTN